MSVLKTCPFCGQQAHTDSFEDLNKTLCFLVGCDTPDCFGYIERVTKVFDDEESAIKAWNRRPESERKVCRCACES